MSSITCFAMIGMENYMVLFMFHSYNNYVKVIYLHLNFLIQLFTICFGQNKIELSSFELYVFENAEKRLQKFPKINSSSGFQKCVTRR